METGRDDPMFERASPGSANSGTLGISTKGAPNLFEPGPPLPPPPPTPPRKSPPRRVGRLLLSLLAAEDRVSTWKRSALSSSSSSSRRVVTEVGGLADRWKRGLLSKASLSCASYREIFRGRGEDRHETGRAFSWKIDRPICREARSSDTLPLFYVISAPILARCVPPACSLLFPFFARLRVFAFVCSLQTNQSMPLSLSLSSTRVFPLRSSPPSFFLFEKFKRRQENYSKFKCLIQSLFLINV